MNNYNMDPYYAPEGRDTGEEEFINLVNKAYSIDPPLTISDVEIGIPEDKEYSDYDTIKKNIRVNTSVTFNITKEDYNGIKFEKFYYHRVPGIDSVRVGNRGIFNQFYHVSHDSYFTFNFFGDLSEEAITKDYKEEFVKYLKQNNSTYTVSEIESVKHRRYSDGKPTGHLNIKIKDNSLVYKGSFSIPIYLDKYNEQPVDEYLEVDTNPSKDVYRLIVGEEETVTIPEYNKHTLYRKSYTKYLGNNQVEQGYSPYYYRSYDEGNLAITVNSKGEVEFHSDGITFYKRELVGYADGYSYRKL